MKAARPRAPAPCRGRGMCCGSDDDAWHCAGRRAAAVTMVACSAVRWTRVRAVSRHRCSSRCVPRRLLSLLALSRIARAPPRPAHCLPHCVQVCVSPCLQRTAHSPGGRCRRQHCDRCHVRTCRPRACAHTGGDGAGRQHPWAEPRRVASGCCFSAPTLPCRGKVAATAAALVHPRLAALRTARRCQRMVRASSAAGAVDAGLLGMTRVTAPHRTRCDRGGGGRPGGCSGGGCGSCPVALFVRCGEVLRRCGGLRRTRRSSACARTFF
ncbi:hypothetical protein LMXM_12_0905 [Leishmania mexicana MHOM/GT/2001/U1103]|uniref:Uncharacterized protein n=1 Tax=Leishmania mexicana (strain MHOM/GT/2001/U1103) TaxID=929439 RepID=E9AP09_LEIMU|nr:hypothetical protein LMXM_12_0905 [Leishmania mexicana MHOM/GT/2001/U1103]CBZ24673.1 hypothetical protein LMXM_12_0905 [Leishmania mexicana MHOM/GT/2001/U1103]